MEANIRRIVLEARNNAVRRARAPRCIMNLPDEGDKLNLSIQDDGIGMPKDYRARVGLRSM